MSGWASVVPKLPYRREVLLRLAAQARNDPLRPLTLMEMAAGSSTAKAAAAIYRMRQEGWVRELGGVGSQRKYVLAEDVVLSPILVGAYFPEAWPIGAPERIRLYRGQLRFELE